MKRSFVDAMGPVSEDGPKAPGAEAPGAGAATATPAPAAGAAAPSDNGSKNAEEETALFVYADALMQASGDKEFLMEIITESIAEAAESLAKLKRIFGSDTLPAASTVRSLAHSVKGLAATFAFYRVRDAAKALEFKARENEVHTLVNRPEKKPATRPGDGSATLTRETFSELSELFDVVIENFRDTIVEIRIRGFAVPAIADEVTAGDG
uniref:HPt domain-containing protein n=1 Tax=Phaeomonas parva TaxID=124430 RepID=A0A7S1XL82_9STRA|mmetsp:Transcript_16865/g.51857  ORF Transcript_16865/g.51857 Transcript_16865/m.51857 type:complete len:210 (+) Transcript_16865:497-1126(+)